VERGANRRATICRWMEILNVNLVVREFVQEVRRRIGEGWRVRNADRLGQGSSARRIAIALRLIRTGFGLSAIRANGKNRDDGLKSPCGHAISSTPAAKAALNLQTLRHG
jgi:hypothetical protein